MKKNLPQPHDSLFKRTMSDPEKVRDFLQGTLPANIYRHLNLDTLRRDTNSYVDKKLKNYFADMVYDCTFGSATQFKITLLFEHKSTVPRYLYIQLLRYMLQIWEHQIEQNKPLQLVLPIVFYHGQDRWNPRSFESYFSKSGLPEELKSFLPKFDYWLENLQETPSESIEERFKIAMLRMTLLLFKYIGSSDILEHLPVIFKGLRSLELTKNRLAQLETLTLYLFEEAKGPQGQIMEVMENLVQSEYKEGTVARFLEQRGIKKGIEKGEYKNKREVARRMLEEGVDSEFIIRISGLHPQTVQELKTEIENETPIEYKEGTVARFLEQRGIKKGKYSNKREVARRMLREGSDLDFIIRVTDLPIQSVRELKAEMDSETPKE